jgi:hypothetical protein
MMWGGLPGRGWAPGRGSGGAAVCFGAARPPPSPSCRQCARPACARPAPHNSPPQTPSPPGPPPIPNLKVQLQQLHACRDVGAPVAADQPRRRPLASPEEQAELLAVVGRRGVRADGGHRRRREARGARAAPGLPALGCGAPRGAGACSACLTVPWRGAGGAWGGGAAAAAARACGGARRSGAARARPRPRPRPGPARRTPAPARPVPSPTSAPLRPAAAQAPPEARGGRPRGAGADQVARRRRRRGQGPGNGVAWVPRSSQQRPRGRGLRGEGRGGASGLALPFSDGLPAEKRARSQLGNRALAGSAPAGRVGARAGAAPVAGVTSARLEGMRVRARTAPARAAAGPARGSGVGGERAAPRPPAAPGLPPWRAGGRGPRVCYSAPGRPATAARSRVSGPRSAASITASCHGCSPW